MENRNINLDNLTSIDKRKVEKFYENYKNKILEIVQEKKINIFKENINRLTELEILIARLEKFDRHNKEMNNNYNFYIQTAKELIAENQSKFNDEYLRKIVLFKYFLAFKMYFFCRKSKLKNEELYFNNIMDSLDYYKIISEFKEDKRKYLFEDEPLDGVFKKEKTGSNSIVKIFKFAGLGTIIFIGIVAIYYLKKRNYNFIKK